MQFVPARKPRSVWRTLIMLFAALLTFGVLAPVTASAHGLTLLQVHDKTVIEPLHGYTTAYVPITLNHRVDHKVTVGWYTKDGTAKAWKDYKPAAGKAIIPKGHRVAFAPVVIKAERHHHGYGDHSCYRSGYSHRHHSEFFFVKLRNAHGALIADGTGVVTIIKQHRPMLPLMFVKDAEVVSSSTADVTASVPVLLSRHTWKDVTFKYMTTDGTAIAGTDYTAVPVTPGMIAKGSHSTTLSVTVLKGAHAGTYFFVKVFDAHGALLPHCIAVAKVMIK